MRVSPKIWTQAMFPERPKLYRHPDGRWLLRLRMVVNANFVCMRYDTARGRLEIGLTRPFREWLELHDPAHRVSAKGTEVVVAFSNENTAMLFRMTYDARVKHG